MYHVTAREITMNFKGFLSINTYKRKGTLLDHLIFSD